MDQSKSSNGNSQIVLPGRSLSLEFFVGLFTVLGVIAAGYLSVGLGGISLGNDHKYELIAEFDNIAGLKNGASVEIAGVQIGDVSKISLDDSVANVTMRISEDVKIQDDDIASIRTKGIIGDRYVKISRGGSDVILKPGAKMTETESVVDLEDIIGKIVHSLTSSEKKADAN